MGLVLRLSCSSFANPIATLTTWVYSCEIAMSLCSVVSRKPEQTYWVTAPFLPGEAAPPGAGGTGGTCTDTVVPPRLCAFAHSSAQRASGAARGAQRSGWEGKGIAGASATPEI